jgi:hypothetical protein
MSIILFLSLVVLKIIKQNGYYMHISKLKHSTSNTSTVKKLTKESLIGFDCILIRFVFFFYSFDVML